MTKADEITIGRIRTLLAEVTAPQTDTASLMMQSDGILDMIKRVRAEVDADYKRKSDAIDMVAVLIEELETDEALDKAQEYVRRTKRIINEATNV